MAVSAEVRAAMRDWLNQCAEPEVRRIPWVDGNGVHIVASPYQLAEDILAERGMGRHLPGFAAREAQRLGRGTPVDFLVWLLGMLAAAPLDAAVLERWQRLPDSRVLSDLGLV